LRETEVQQPNTTATFFFSSSSRAFSANRGQSEAGSTTTASSCLPSTPPFLFCSSMSISMVSFKVVSLMAMVPDSEWRIPTLMVSAAVRAPDRPSPTAAPRPMSDLLMRPRFRMGSTPDSWSYGWGKTRGHRRSDLRVSLTEVESPIAKHSMSFRLPSHRSPPGAGLLKKTLQKQEVGKEAS